MNPRPVLYLYDNADIEATYEGMVHDKGLQILLCRFHTKAGFPCRLYMNSISNMLSCQQRVIVSISCTMKSSSTVDESWWPKVKFIHLAGALLRIFYGSSSKTPETA